MDRRQIENQLIDKASHDTAFRQALISDPRAAIEKEFGITIPGSLKLQVIEECADRLCLVLPAAQGELSDLELESVAGGKNPSGGISAIVPKLDLRALGGN